MYIYEVREEHGAERELKRFWRTLDARAFFFYFFFILMYIYEVREEHGAERELKRFFLFLEKKNWDLFLL